MTTQNLTGKAAQGGLVSGVLTSDSAVYTYSGQQVARRWFYYIPSTWQEGQRLPLVFSLHGSGENASMQLNEGKWTELAEQEGFIVVGPEAVAIHADGTLSAEGKRLAEIGQTTAAYIRWHACNTDPIDPYGVDDVAYLSDLIDRFVSLGYADPDRVYSTGLSHGAFMSMRFAVEAPQRVAGIGPVCGLITAEMAAKLTDKRVKMVFVNGTSDPIVPYNGMYFNGVAWAYSTDETIERVLAAYRLTVAEVRESTLPDLDPEDGLTISRFEYVDTNGNVPVVKYRVNGGGHTWPGGTQYFPVSFIGPLCNDAQASHLIWAELKNVTNPNR